MTLCLRYIHSVRPLELAAASLGNPLASPDLAEIKEAAKGAKMSRVVQESLRADLSLFLVRHVQDVVEVTENSLAGWQSGSSARPTPDAVRMVFRRHAANVLDLVQLLPGCDVAQATAEIERSIELIEKDTAHQLNMLATDQSVTLPLAKSRLGGGVATG